MFTIGCICGKFYRAENFLTIFLRPCGMLGQSATSSKGSVMVASQSSRTGVPNGVPRTFDLMTSALEVYYDEDFFAPIFNLMTFVGAFFEINFTWSASLNFIDGTNTSGIHISW